MRSRVWFVTAVCICGFLHCQQDAAADDIELQFPREAVGVVCIFDPERESFARVLPAKGIVIVPDDPSLVTIEISSTDIEDLKCLSNLPENSVGQLVIHKAAISDEALHQISRLSSLRELRFKGCKFARTNFRNAPTVPDLRELFIDDIDATNAFEWIVRHRKLEMLYCSPNPTLEELRGISGHPSLRSLSVRLGEQPSEVIRGAASLPELRNLVVMASNDLEAESLRDAVKIDRLEELRWFGAMSDPEVLARIIRKTSLKSLVISQAEPTVQLSKFVGELGSLESLELHYSGQNKISCELWLPRLRSLPHLRRWTVLHDIDANSLSLLSECKQIEHLSLAGLADGVTAEDVSDVLKSLVNLKSLQLSHIPFTDAMLMSLRDSVSLEDIGLVHTRVTGSGFEPLVDLPNLRRVFLFYGAHEWEYIACDLSQFPKLPSLEEIEIWGSRIDQDDLVPLGACDKLKKVRFLGGFFSDDRLVKRLSALPNLVDLTLDDNCVVSDEGVEYLTKSSKLQRLQVGGFISEDGAKKLAEIQSMKLLSIRSKLLTGEDSEAIRLHAPSLPVILFSWSRWDTSRCSRSSARIGRRD